MKLDLRYLLLSALSSVALASSPLTTSVHCVYDYSAADGPNYEIWLQKAEDGSFALSNKHTQPFQTSSSVEVLAKDLDCTNDRKGIACTGSDPDGASFAFALEEVRASRPFGPRVVFKATWTGQAPALEFSKKPMRGTNVNYCEFQN